MSFLTDLSLSDRIELKLGDSWIRIKIVKRTGSKVRLSINANYDIQITKIDTLKEAKDGRKNLT